MIPPIIEATHGLALPRTEAPTSHRAGRDWAFDALTWCTLRLGGIGPIRRARMTSLT